MTPGKKFKEKMLRITRTAKFITSEVYDPSEDAFRQMDSLVEQVLKAKEFMQTFKPKEEDTTQQSFLLDAQPVLGEEVHT